MRKPAGVEHGDYDRGFALRDIPCGVGARGGGLLAQQIPLLHQQRIVRERIQLASVLDGREFDIGMLLELTNDTLELIQRNRIG
jgi:hypothetical protein